MIQIIKYVGQLGRVQKQHPLAWQSTSGRWQGRGSADAGGEARYQNLTRACRVEKILNGGSVLNDERVSLDPRLCSQLSPADCFPVLLGQMPVTAYTALREDDVQSADAAVHA
jgi:hypothetical protein